MMPGLVLSVHMSGQFGRQSNPPESLQLGTHRDLAPGAIQSCRIRRTVLQAGGRSVVCQGRRNADGSVT